MLDFLGIIISQILPFLPLAYAISISYNVLQATDLTLDSSFVLGAGLFAHLVTIGINPFLAMGIALIAGAGAGVATSLIQYKGRVDPLLAGILAVFIFTSLNLLIMGRPNINLLGQTTILSDAFNHSGFYGNLYLALYSVAICIIAFILINSKFGLSLRALGENSYLLQRLGYRIEIRRMAGFGLTNMMSAFAGILTAQSVGYADLNMSLGMTLTGIGAIIIGGQLLHKLTKKHSKHRVIFELSACLLGVSIYFTIMNTLLRYDLDPLYLKLVLGITLVIFLRMANKSHKAGD